jgi:DNA-binding response OmpR family regulator
MIVEDDEELNDILLYNLRRAGYEVAQAWDGKQAMDLMTQDPPALVLLDLMLPEASGWEVCQHMADSPELRAIPVIIFTARGTREDFDDARKFNVAGYFTKPYATADVLRHVEKVLGTGQNA